MRTVAVIGASGGAGVTTVAASLARALHAAGHPALAFDINPDNTLRLPFGMHWDDRFGLGRRQRFTVCGHGRLRRFGQQPSKSLGCPMSWSESSSLLYHRARPADHHAVCCCGR